MPVSPARAAAYDVLLRVEREAAYASELLHSTRYDHLSSADHGLATELVMGVLRWQSLLDSRIAQQSKIKFDKLDSEVLVSLRLAAYQLWFLDRVPGRAAVHESVELVKLARKRSAVPFVNAVLRKLAPPTARLPDSAVAVRKNAPELAEAAAHPLWLVERWIREFGFEAATRICFADQQIPPVSIRFADSAVRHELRDAGIELSPGLLLTSRSRVIAGDVSHSRPFRQKLLAIQDEASQLVALVVGQGSSLLDCCAAPGGKTRILTERNPNAIVLAAEVHPHRARLLQELVPAKNVRVIIADARNLPTTRLFDRVLVDVPCSGTGTLARNPEIKWRLKLADLRSLQALQLAILQSAMQRVAPGGRLVYSTCSLEREENQTVVESALSMDGSFRIVDCRERLMELRAQAELAWEDIDSLTNGPYLWTLPGVHPCDGFFAAILEKN